jgi:hypothetical protein
MGSEGTNRGHDTHDSDARSTVAIRSKRFTASATSRRTTKPHDSTGAAQRIGEGRSESACSMSDVEALLTESELSREIKISPITLQQWRHRGEGPPFFKLGRAVRYRRADVTAWLASRRIGVAS